MNKEHKTDGTPCWCNPRVVKVLSKEQENLIERLADIEHQRWSDWQKYMMSESFKITGVFTDNDNKKMIQLEIPKEYWDNWERQVKTPYSELSEEEKDSDREQIGRYWDLISKKTIMEKEPKTINGKIDTGKISDGYHTFDELYEHRIILFIALCKQIDNQPYDGDEYKIWRSKLHSDDTMFEGWFIMGIGKEKGRQITYHLSMSSWKETEFAETLENAPEWDNHTPKDVLNRIKEL